MKTTITINKIDVLLTIKENITYAGFETTLHIGGKGSIKITRMSGHEINPIVFYDIMKKDKTMKDFIVYMTEVDDDENAHIIIDEDIDYIEKSDVRTETEYI